MKRRVFFKNLALSATGAIVLPNFSKASSIPVENIKLTPESKLLNKGEQSEKFSRNNAVRSGMALGGIGAGTIELRKDGKFYNWNIFNNFPKETGPAFHIPMRESEDSMSSIMFFVVRYEVEGEMPQLRLLQINSGLNEGAVPGAAYYFPWLKAIESIEYSARFPFTIMKFTDAEMPLEIEMKAWTPFIPHDVKNSSLPLSYFDFKITSKTEKKVDVMIIASLRNMVGYETDERVYVTEILNKAGYKTVSMTSTGMNEKLSTHGQMAMTSLNENTSHYTGWGLFHPYYEYVVRNKTLPNIDDTNGIESLGSNIPDWMPRTNGRNIINPKTNKRNIQGDIESSQCYSSLGYSMQFSSLNQENAHCFAFTWNFPNLYADIQFRKMSDKIEGHYYNNFFQNAAEVADYAVAKKNDLLARSEGFLNNFYDSSADSYVLDQVNSQLNTFVTSGRLVKSGDFGVLEGLAPSWSWGPIATMDVMMYGTVPIIALFPELQKSTMIAHSKIQSEIGEVAHGMQKDFKGWEDGTAGVSHRLDLPGQFVIMIMRDYFWTNDKSYLTNLWPKVKKAIDYIIDHRDFNSDGLPTMKGIECSYDNFPMYGYASYIMSQWLCAMASAIEAAEIMGDTKAKAKYQKIFDIGSKKMDEKLWNGKYYRLYNDDDKAGGKGNIDEGCLADQIIGQWAANHSGLGYLFKKEHVKQALKSIYDMCFIPNFGLKNCSWPGAKFFNDIPREIWVDQGNTYWTGVELAFASFLIYEGFVKEGLEVVKTVDQRYRENGLYFDHQEFGGHYFRPMAAWAIINSLLGFSLNCQKYSFAPKTDKKAYKYFFATPSGTANYNCDQGKVSIKVLTGEMSFAQISLSNSGILSKKPVVALDSKILNPKVTVEADKILLNLATIVQVKAGQILTIA